MEEKRFLTVDDICQILECSKSYSYGVIRQLNEELKAKGFITHRGRVSSKYFHERSYEGAS